MRYFLIAYHRREGRMVADVRAFGDQDTALGERFRLEAERQDSDIEFVVLGAESESDLHTTHARYFKSVRELVQG